MTQLVDMEDWEFLLQKEGDRSWLPITTRELQIEAGRYRMVAYTSRTLNPVEVRILYQESSDLTSESISQRHSRQINSEGMMVVIPYIFLKPGIWKLSCSGDILSDLLNQPWREEIELQILSEKPRENLVLSFGGTSHSQDNKQYQSSPEPQNFQITINTSQSSLPITATLQQTDSPSDVPFIDATAQPTTETIIGSDSPTDNVALPLITEIMQETEINADSATEIPPITNNNNEEKELIIGVDSPSGIVSQSTQKVTNINPGVEELIVGTDGTETALTTTDNNEEKELIVGVDSPSGIVSQSVEEVSEINSGVEELIVGTDGTETALTTTDNNEEKELIVGVDSPSGIVSQSVEEVSEINSGVEELIVGTDGTETALTTTDNNEEKELIVGVDSPSGIVSQSTQEVSEINSGVEELIVGTDAIEAPLNTTESNEEKELIIGVDSPEEIPNLANSNFTDSQPLPEQIVLTLDQDILVRNQQTPMVVSGYIEIPNEQENSTTNQLFYGQLSYQVRNPQTSEIVINIQHDLPPQTLPIQFNHQLEITPEQEIPLLLGEVIISSQIDDIAIILAKQTFHITAEVNQLWESVADSQSDEDAKSTESTDLLEVTNETKTDENLSPIITESTVTKEPDSPQLTDNTLEETNQNQSETSEVSPQNETELKETSSIVINGETETSPEEKETENSQTEDPIDKAFRALNLTKRFWIRLFSIARDQELLKLLRQAIYQDSSDANIDWGNQEIVVEDEQLETPFALDNIVNENDNLLVNDSVAITSTNQSETLSSEQLAKEIPIPILSVTQGELVAGKTVAVRVKLPPDSNSMYVKLWLQDCQTHYILEGPRNLVEFVRNQDGELESLTQITVPLGSVEIRFEAVTVDLETRRESYKATVERGIIPADLPSMSLEEFEE